MKNSSFPPQIKQHLAIPIAIFLCLIGFAFLTAGKAISLGPGVKAPEAPVQASPTGRLHIEHESYHITALADYDCTAKIISKKTYSDEWSDICPIDMTLGWQKMSDDNFIKYVDFDQRTRWTFYNFGTLPDGLTRAELTSQHANVHMCPANDEVRSVLLSLPKGCVIHFQGKLIQLRNKETGWNAKSSLIRTDTRAGACEIVWIEQLKTLN